MEPRPPRPRQQYLPPEPGASPARPIARPGEGMYAPPPGGYAAPAYPPELDLLPRQQRHRQRIARNILLALLAVVAVAALAWFVRDRFFTGAPPTQLAQIAPTPQPNLPVAAPPSSPAVATTAPDNAFAPPVNSLLSTTTPTPPSAPEPTPATGANAEPTSADSADSADAAETQAPAAPVNLEALLPTEEELPVSGLPATNEGDRTRAEVLATFGGEEAQADADARLEEWGWRANIFRDFSVDPTLI